MVFWATVWHCLSMEYLPQIPTHEASTRCQNHWHWLSQQSCPQAPCTCTQSPLLSARWITSQGVGVLMERGLNALMPLQDSWTLLPSRWVLATVTTPWTPSGTIGTGTKLSSSVSLCYCSIMWPHWCDFIQPAISHLPTVYPYISLALGSSLYMKLIKAKLASWECKADFDHFTLSQKYCATKWEQMVAAWEANHSKHDPYVVVKYGKYCYLLCCSYAHLIIVSLTEANIKLLLAKQEEVLVAQGTPPLHNKWNTSTFIIAGLGLEDLQFITQLIVSTV